MVYSVEIEFLRRVYDSLLDRVKHGETGQHLADAIDHIGTALRLLGAQIDNDD